VPAGDHKKLEAAYRQLQTELANLHESKLALEKHIHRLTRLRGHFGPKPIFISAGVVGSDSSILRDIKRLAHNGGDYLKTGQMAVADVADGKAEDGSRKAAVEPAAGAVVGRIIGQPGKRTADLQLLSDREFQLPVIIKPHPLRKESWSVTGLLKGRGAGQISVIRVPTEYAVRPGDLVIARADPKYLPAALMVGTVGDCRRYEKNLVLWDIRVKPAADPRTLQDVIIIRPD